MFLENVTIDFFDVFARILFSFNQLYLILISVQVYIVLQVIQIHSVFALKNLLHVLPFNLIDQTIKLVSSAIYFGILIEQKLFPEIMPLLLPDIL